MLEVKCRVVGLHSLFLNSNTGTDAERHVVFCDLDRVPHHKDPQQDPEGFKAALRKVLYEFGASDAYVFATLKGVHVFCPQLMTRLEAERFEERLEDWGADGFHRFMGYKNGGTVMRVSAKPGEVNGPRFLWHVRGPVLKTRSWSGAHFDFINDLHGGDLRAPPTSLRNDAAEEVRLEAYDTQARFEAQTTLGGQ